MVISRGAGLEDLIRVIYPNISSLNLPDQYFSEHIILAPCNPDVHSINEHILGKYPGEEYLNSINASGLPLSKLGLKFGSPIILLHNLSVQDGLCNGTCLCVEHLGGRVIQACILGGFHNGKVPFIPRMTLTPSDLGKNCKLC